MIILTLLSFISIFLLLHSHRFVFWVGRSVGQSLRAKSVVKRVKILDKVEKEEEEWELVGKERRDSEEWESIERETTRTVSMTAGEDDEWDGIVGFLHPFCNAGGGGERVLWAGIRAIQKRWPRAKCVIYTGDLDVNKEACLARVQNRFNISLYPPTIIFLYLTTRPWVLASNWPNFTLLGQSFGSLVLCWESFSLLVPDIFVDTMGYAFSLAFCKLLFPRLPTGAYVHYPTISTDMLSSLASNPPFTVHGLGRNLRLEILRSGKKLYWNLFAKLYSFVGGSIDVVITNSTWTQEHIISFWGPWRSRFKREAPLIVYPPVSVKELVQKIEISKMREKDRVPIILYLGQFRPEKNHRLILNSFSKFKRTGSFASSDAKLVLVGSVRDQKDSIRAEELRLLAQELQIKDSVIFHLDATWIEVLDWLIRGCIGVNGMWNEHFGIGVVEYQAAGLIPVVHNSGGPKLDIVRPLDGQPTGFTACTAGEYAACYEAILNMSDQERVEMRQRARKNTERFTEEMFTSGWILQIEKLVEMSRSFMGL